MADQASQMIEAARRGDLAGVRACLAAGADANAHDGSGWGPLHMAAMGGHHECVPVAALIAGGANVNILDNTQRSRMLVACSSCWRQAQTRWQAWKKKV